MFRDGVETRKVNRLIYVKWYRLLYFNVNQGNTFKDNVQQKGNAF